MHHAHGTGRVGAHNHISAVRQTDEGVNVSLMGMSRERINEEDQGSKIFHAHECGNLGISTKRSGGARQPILNLWVLYQVGIGWAV